MGCPYKFDKIFIRENIKNLSFNINCRNCARLYYRNGEFKRAFIENPWRK